MDKIWQIPVSFRPVCSRSVMYLPFLFFVLIVRTTLLQAQLAQNNFYLNNEIKFERLAIENGLSNNIAFGMTQDKKGFIWFATLDALIKYDGHALTRYQNDPKNTNSLGDNIVMSVFEDHTGLIWVGTAGGGGVNSFDPQTEQWKRYPHDPKNANSMGKGSIEGIAEDRKGMLWFGSTDGLTRYNPKTNRFTLFENNPNDKYSLSNNRIYSIVEDNAGLLWIGTDKGVNIFDPKKESFYLVEGDLKVSLKLEKSEIHHIYKDRKGLLWLSAYDHGVFVMDSDSKKCIAHYGHDLNNPNSIGSDVVFATTQDLTGSYWVSTEGGLYQFNPETSVFKLYENKSYLPNTETKGHCIMTDRAGLVWIGTKGRGVIYFSPQQRNFRRYLNDEASLLFGSGSNRIKSIFQSKDNQLYVATSENLLRFDRGKDKFEEVWQLKTIKKNDESFVLTTASEEKPGIFWLGTDQAGIIRYDSYTHKVTFLQNNCLDIGSLANNSVNVLYKDRSGKIWVGTEGGDLQWYDPSTKKFVHYRYLTENEEVPPNAGIRFIYVDRKGNLWLGIRAFHLGLGGNGLYDINVKTGEIKHYTHHPDVLGSLSNNSVTCLYEDRKGLFWIGTYGGGLNKLDAGSGEISVFTEENGLLSNTVQGLAGDGEGNLWIMADGGITRFNSTSLSTKQYGSADGLATSPLGVESEDYNAYLSMESAEGDIYFGSNNGQNGIIKFHPSAIQENKFRPPVVITQFKVFDKNYPIAGKGLSLTYNQNFFDVEFAALSYLSSGKNQYAYKLEGVDNDWVNNGTRRIAHYTNVSPGTYTFRVKGSNNDGIWNNQGASLAIVIHAPWWQTWWAYTLYTLLAGTLAYWFYRFQLSRKLAVSESLRLKEVNQLKSSLYTNITHEFRTPLTVILGMADSAKSTIAEKQFDDVEESLDMIQRNGKNLLRLVNEMLDLAKLESGNMELQLIQADVVPFMKYICESFHSMAKASHIDLMVYSEIDELVMDFDANKLTSITANLLSNAIKFTLPGGKIVVHLNSIAEKGKNLFFLRIKDDGMGIAEEALPHIFDRFYQANASSSLRNEGTGIGLALTKEFTEQMGGAIEVKSTVGKGSEFNLHIPITKNAHKTADVRPSNAIALYSEKIDISSEQTLESDTQLPLLLIIEDNADIAHYLKTCLKGKYEIIYAADGIIGIETAYEKVPDIIICDVMMPGKDGYEVCTTLKSDERTDHIPIILLTAKVTQQDRITGLSHGADAYLTKPFNKVELFTHLDQLILLRQKMVQKFEREGFGQFLKVRTENSEIKFLKSTVKIIQEKMGDHSFGSRHLARQLSMSESQLYRKLKAITGKSTAIFIRSVRLQKAKELIQTTNGNISEVAYDVGFNDLSWFSRAFKEEFGFAPSEHRK